MNFQVELGKYFSYFKEKDFKTKILKNFNLKNTVYD